MLLLYFKFTYFLHYYFSECLKINSVILNLAFYEYFKILTVIYFEYYATQTTNECCRT